MPSGGAGAAVFALSLDEATGAAALAIPANVAQVAAAPVALLPASTVPATTIPAATEPAATVPAATVPADAPVAALDPADAGMLPSIRQAVAAPGDPLPGDPVEAGPAPLPLNPRFALRRAVLAEQPDARLQTEEEASAPPPDPRPEVPTPTIPVSRSATRRAAPDRPATRDTAAAPEEDEAPSEEAKTTPAPVTSPDPLPLAAEPAPAEPRPAAATVHAPERAPVVHDAAVSPRVEVGEDTAPVRPAARRGGAAPPAHQVARPSTPAAQRTVMPEVVAADPAVTVVAVPSAVPPRADVGPAPVVELPVPDIAAKVRRDASPVTAAPAAGAGATRTASEAGTPPIAAPMHAPIGQVAQRPSTPVRQGAADEMPAPIDFADLAATPSAGAPVAPTITPVAERAAIPVARPARSVPSVAGLRPAAAATPRPSAMPPAVLDAPAMPQVPWRFAPAAPPVVAPSALTPAPMPSAPAAATMVDPNATVPIAMPEAATARSEARGAPTPLVPQQPQPAAPAPAMPAVMAPAPAGIVFASAIAAATDERDRRPAADPASPLPEPTALVAPVAPVARADTGGQAPLDLTQPRWPTAMIERIETLRDAADAADTRIRLVPDALGAIEVAVRREGDTLHVRFTAEEAQTRTLLQDAQPRLAEAAADRGLKLGQASVEMAAPRDAGGGSQQQNGGSHGSTGGQPGAGFQSAQQQQQPQQGRQHQPATPARPLSAGTPANTAEAADDDGRLA